MNVAIFCKNRIKTQEVVERLKRLWGDRGLAVHATDFHSAAREATLAAYHILDLHEEGIRQDAEEDLVQSIIQWGNTQDDALWYSKFKKSTDLILSNWREKCLPHVFVVHGFREGKELSLFKDYLRIKIGPSVSPNTYGFHLGFDEEENTEDIAVEIMEHCAQKMNGIFDEPKRVP